MKIAQLPGFAKDMGHKIIEYILNTDEENAKQIIENKGEIQEDQQVILNNYIEVCRQLRRQGAEHGDPNFDLFHTLPNLFSPQGQHVFNIWHTQMGGIWPSLAEVKDELIKNLAILALGVYPLFLIKLPINSISAQAFQISHPALSAIYKMPEYKKILENIRNDSVLGNIFFQINENPLNTITRYRSSNVLGQPVQLSLLPSLIIHKAYLLAKLSGSINQINIIRSVSEVIRMLRSVAEREEIELPLVLGFSNVNLNGLDSFVTKLGTIETYHGEWLELMPPLSNALRPIQDQYLILKTKYPFKGKFITDQTEWEKSSHEEQQKIQVYVENLQRYLSLTFALGIEKNRPVSIIHHWTLLFDPLSWGLDLNWKNSFITPLYPYSVTPKDVESIQSWSKIITSANNEKLKTAIFRILSAINERTNPVDGFIDSMIALESLFGGNTELNLRISSSIARLLGNSLDERKLLQGRVKELYDDRGRIVHGSDKKFNSQEIFQKRDECIKITLDCLRKIYKFRQDLISSTSIDRSNRLLIE